jgi:hypothetical protein
VWRNGRCRATMRELEGNQQRARKQARQHKETQVGNMGEIKPSSTNWREARLTQPLENGSGAHARRTKQGALAPNAPAMCRGVCDPVSVRHLLTGALNDSGVEQTLQIIKNEDFDTSNNDPRALSRCSSCRDDPQGAKGKTGEERGWKKPDMSIREHDACTRLETTSNDRDGHPGEMRGQQTPSRPSKKRTAKKRD